jgi:hypothetical protein
MRFHERFSIFSYLCDIKTRLLVKKHIVTLFVTSATCDLMQLFD